ncbi:MAG: hypothetical protein J7L57_01205, partial [Deltaproteobacteria bacterium]|nr:hypothetical protein [Candidatus Tharpella sp.]
MGAENLTEPVIQKATQEREKSRNSTIVTNKEEWQTFWTNPKRNVIKEYLISPLYR